MPEELLDQSQTASGNTWGTGAAYFGQSFTVGTDGLLAKVRFQTTTVSGATFELYSGGISGVAPAGPLVQTVSISTVSGWNTVTLSEPVPVVAGDVYTFRIFSGSQWSHQMVSEAYPGGRSLAGSSYDILFETYVTVCSE